MLDFLDAKKFYEFLVNIFSKHFTLNPKKLLALHELRNFLKKIDQSYFN